MISIQEIEARMAAKPQEIRQLLKTYKIKYATGIAAIKEGFERFGQPFMIDFLKIISVQAGEGDPYFVGPMPYEDTGTTSGGGGNFWSILDNLFSAADKGADIWNKIQGGGTQQNPTLTNTPVNQISKPNYLLYGGIALAVLILIIVIIKILK